MCMRCLSASRFVVLINGDNGEASSIPSSIERRVLYLLYMFTCCAAGIKELAAELGSSNGSLDLNRSASVSQANMEGGGDGPLGRRASEVVRRGRSSLTAASLIDAIILDQIKRTDPDDLGLFCSVQFTCTLARAFKCASVLGLP